MPSIARTLQRAYHRMLRQRPEIRDRERQFVPDEAVDRDAVGRGIEVRDRAVVAIVALLRYETNLPISIINSSGFIKYLSQKGGTDLETRSATFGSRFNGFSTEYSSYNAVTCQQTQLPYLRLTPSG